MSFNKIATAVLNEPTMTPAVWSSVYGNQSPLVKAASFNKYAGELSKYLLSHATIMASVMTEDDPYDFLIKPECSHLVNNNDDSWENRVLQQSYKSFRGAFNFLEHYQNTKAAKGHIVDAVLRKVAIAPAVWVYFCDILVATDLAHTSLVNDIRTKKIKYLSMGCVTDLVICSFCGARVTDANNYCQHLYTRKGEFMEDEDGIPRRVAELCGHKSLPNGGVRFVEASWVHTPAFPGAANRGTVAEEWVGPKTRFTRAVTASSKTASYQDRPINLDEARVEARLRSQLGMR